jgi:hypothetical protein
MYVTRSLLAYHRYGVVCSTERYSHACARSRPPTSHTEQLEINAVSALFGARGTALLNIPVLDQSAGKVWDVKERYCVLVPGPGMSAGR